MRAAAHCGARRDDHSAPPGGIKPEGGAGYRGDPRPTDLHAKGKDAQDFG